MTEELNSMMLIVTETHLNSEISDAEVNMEGFLLYRADREGRKCGGVAIYLRKDIAKYTVKVTSGSDSYVEFLMIHIKKLNLVVAAVYSPPQVDRRKLFSAMDQIKLKYEEIGEPSPSLVICGDFNLPGIDWTNSSQGLSGHIRDYMQTLRDDLFLTQIILAPTRNDNILDLCFVNNEDWIMNTDIREDKSLSDHNLIIIDTSLEFNNAISGVPFQQDSLDGLNFYNERTDWSAINEELCAINWQNVLLGKTVDQMYSIIMEKLLEICRKHVPRRINRNRKSLIPRDRKALFRRKRRILGRRLRNDSDRERQKLDLEELGREMKLSHEKELKNEEEKAVAAIKRNPKYFYKYVKSKTHTRSPVGPLKRGNELVTENKDMCELLNEQYISAFSTPKPDTQDHSENNNITEEQSPTLNCFEVVEEDFIEAIKSLQSNSSSGPDGVQAILLKKCGVPLSVPLCIMWKESLRTGRIPEVFKKGVITPLHKGGGRSVPKNYRPVTLTSHFIKLFEKIVVNRLSKFMSDNHLYNSNQHGFRSGRSCLSQLMDHYQQIVRILTEGSDVDVIYLDFAKAFDKVDHNILLLKLQKMGVNGSVLKWIKSFLANRKQTVRVDGSESSEADVISGVPQGSVLGPLLFIIYISDINLNLTNSRVSSFADDTRVFRKINSTEDSELLQRDIDKIYFWAESNNMKFNSNKFELIRYTRRTDDSVGFQYKASDASNITRKSQTRDLGVTMSDSGNFKEHVQQSAATGRGKVGFICRTFATRKREHLLPLYKAIALPALEYCSPLWCPSDKNSLGLIRELENVQRSFTRKVEGLDTLDYWGRLKELKLYSLERRRERYCIIYIWKMMNDLVPNFEAEADALRFVEHNYRENSMICNGPTRVRGGSQKWSTIMEDTLAVRGPKLFNSMPADLRKLGPYESDGSPSVKKFKAKLDAFLARIPDEPRVTGYRHAVVSNSLLHKIPGDWRRAREIQ